MLYEPSADEIKEAIIAMTQAGVSKDKLEEAVIAYLEKQKAMAIASNAAKYPQFDNEELIKALSSMAIKPLQGATEAQPTDNPSTSLLKELFHKVLNIQKQNGLMSTFSNNITKFIVQGTVHSNIASYQSD